MNDDPMYVEIQHEARFVNAAMAAEKHFKLINSGVLPKFLHGSFTVTMGLRLLRAVFGVNDNLAAIAALTDVVKQRNAWVAHYQKEFDKHENN